MAEPLGEKGLIFAATIILILGFFSSSFAYTGQHHVGINTIGRGIGDDSGFSCRDVLLAEAYLRAGENRDVYDLNDDGRFNARDIPLIEQEARTRPCESIGDECTHTYCRSGKIFVQCENHPKGFWKYDSNGNVQPLKVQVAVQCEAGQNCRNALTPDREPECAYTFKG